MLFSVTIILCSLLLRPGLGLEREELPDECFEALGEAILLDCLHVIDDNIVWTPVAVAHIFNSVHIHLLIKR